MRLFLKSRSWWQTTLAALLFELTLPLWATQTLAFNHQGFSDLVPLTVIVQFVPVALLLYSTSSPHRQLEALSARRLDSWNVGFACIAATFVFAGAIAASLIEGSRGTLGLWAPPLTLTGMFGMSLCAALFIDRRAAAVVSLIPILAPLTIDPRPLLLNQAWSFVVPGNGSGVDVWAVSLWFVAGLFFLWLRKRTARRFGATR